MRIVIDLTTKIAKEILDYIAEGSAEPEVVIKVRLAPKRGEPQSLPIVWEVEFLPNNGGIYRSLLKGGNK